MNEKGRFTMCLLFHGKRNEQKQLSVRLCIICDSSLWTEICRQYEDIACYTEWFDHDNPSGRGACETLKDLDVELPRKICFHPLTIQTASISGVPAENTGQALLLVLGLFYKAEYVILKENLAAVKSHGKIKRFLPTIVSTIPPL
ncbi:hypothetical protein P4O66_015154 [Electrophorus voltai]|uniref:WxxW domain-containing protein n=1 Tax=Electrophorus voltai TaxID=2609070 RepID=A0AAD8YXM7_9TELE|nr:hypothetical protein P4O66_015154 [Electrophorus voltai]